MTGQETTRKRASLSFMSSLKKLRVPPTPRVQEAPLHPSMFAQKTWICVESHPNLSLCGPDLSRSQHWSFKSIAAKEFENETHRTMGTAKGQGLTACSALPRKSHTPPGMLEVLGSRSSRMALTCVGPGPHFVRLDRSQEIQLSSPLTSS